MTVSKRLRVMHLDYLTNTEKFPYTAELEYFYWSNYQKEITEWLEKNNRDYYGMMFFSVPGNTNFRTTRLVFSNLEDSFDFKVAWL
jgi:hypothetical protein